MQTWSLERGLFYSILKKKEGGDKPHQYLLLSGLPVFPKFSLLVSSALNPNPLFIVTISIAVVYWEGHAGVITEKEMGPSDL